MTDTFDAINAAANTSDTARRVAMLQDAGHTWMDPQAQLALANSSMPDDHVSSAADQMSQLMNDSTQAASNVFEDPVLHKAPSTTMQLSQWVGSNVGYLPVEQSDLSQVQSQLQAKGFGVGLPTDGTWDSAWNSQFQQAAYQHLLEQSNQVGQVVPPHQVAHSFLEGLFPSHAVPKLWGWIKSVPGDVRSVAADAVGGVSAMYKGVESGLLTGTSAGVTSGGQRVVTAGETPGQAYGNAAAAVEHALGNKQITAENISAHPVARLVNDLSTLMMFVPAGRLGSPLAKALGEDILRGTAKETVTHLLDASVAKRGPGVIANSLVRNPQGFGFDALGKVFNNGVAKNIPVLKYVYPNIIEPTAREDGWYYATRRIAAQPMRVPVVNLAARASQYTTMLGASAQGTAALANRITGTTNGNETQLAKSVYDQHTITGITGMAMDLVMQLGKPTLGLKPSETVGAAVRGAEALTNRALGGVNDVPLQFDRAMRGSVFRKGDFQYDRLVSSFGKTKVDWYLNQMLDRFAASRAAKTMLYAQGLPADGNVADRLAELTHQVWQSPHDLAAAKQDLLLDPEGMMHAFWEQRNDIVADAQGRNVTGLGNYFNATDDAHNLFKNWGNILVHPGVYAKLAQDRQAVKDANEAQTALPLAGDQPLRDPNDIIPTQSYVRNNVPAPEAGRLGLARLDSETSGDARQKFFALARRLKAAGEGDAVDAELKKSDLVDMADGLGEPHPDFVGNAQAASDEVEAVRKEAWDYLTKELGKNPHELSVRGAPQMVGTILQESKRLSAAVSAPVDAPAEVRDLFDALKEKGYKPVWGTDIGHHLADPIVDPAVIESHRRWTRKIASGLGINTEHYSTDAPGMVAKRDTLRRWQELINEGKVKPSAGMNASRLWEWSMAQSEKKPLSVAGRTGFAMFRRFHSQAAQLMVNSGKAEDLEQAYSMIQNDLGASNATIATMGRKQFVKAMTALPPEVIEANRLQGLPDETPIITEAEAEMMHRQAMLAMAARPMSMMGASKLEDVARASFTPLGVVANTKVPLLSDVAARAATLPNDLIRARDALKFKFSPIFSARRVTKTVVKMIAAGIKAPTFTPLKALNDAGGPSLVGQAIDYLDKIYPEDQIKGAGWDAMDRFLNSNDIFGFSPRHYMAYAAWDLKQQGKGIAETRKTLDKIFTYGNRTALERTMGTIWYPFSFEKSLYKLLGGYLLDQPTQRAALAMGMDAYHAVDQHAHIQDWLDKHLPVAKELEKLNAFTEGVGLGQFGGINAPLLNMFLPQHNNTPLPSRVMQAAIPAYNDLNALLLGYDPKTGKSNLGGQIGDTLKVSYWAAANQAQDVANRLSGTKPSILAQHRPAEDAYGQNEDGWQLRNALITSMSSVINYNYHNPNAPYAFGTGPDVPPDLRGQKVDRTTIGYLVQRFFPLFDPNAAQPLAQAKQQAADHQIAVIAAANPERGAAFRTFQQAADKVNTYATKGEYQPAQLAQITENFRSVAVHLSETDSAFLKFYNTYYLRLFGPIENVTG